MPDQVEVKDELVDNGQQADRSERVCRHCYEKINSQASVCPSCQRSQSRLSRLLDAVGLTSAVAAVALVLIALLQYCEARSERVEVGEALERASDAERAAQEARALLDLNHLVWRAENDDLPALERLADIAKSSDRDQNLAAEAVDRILNRPYDTLTAGPGIDLEKYGLVPLAFTIGELRDVYPTMKPGERNSAVWRIWSQRRFSVGEKLSFLAFVLETDTSVAVVTIAIDLMNREARIDDIKTNADVENAPLRKKEFLDWWAANRARYDQ